MISVLNLLFQGTYSVINGGLTLIEELCKKESTPNYAAEFGDETDHLSRLNFGYAVTGLKALTKIQSHSNCAVFGPTSSGKSSIVIISSAFSLARSKSSMIFNDPSGEIFQRTSGYLSRKGYKILHLDFSNSSRSETFNPLAKCHTIADIQKVALLIIRNALGQSKSDPFWEQAACALISLLATYLVFYAEPQYRTLQNVLRLLEKFAVEPEAIDRIFVQTNDEELLSVYQATVVVGDKTLQSIIISARTALNLFCEQEVCKTTSDNSIDFDLFRREPVALYICNPLKDLMYYKPLSALFIQSLFNHVLSRIPNKDERSIFFLLDEAATMTFPSLSLTVSNIRKYSAGLLLAMQDEMALIAQYGQAEAHQIKTNCGCQVYLKGQPLHTCKELSQILGKYTYTDKKGQDRIRELATPDEIRMLDEAIILIGNYPPLKCKTVPYFENIWIHHRTKSPPYQVPRRTAENPPLIPLGNE